jgi:ferredoxin
MAKIKVDKEKCIGCDLCCTLSPDTFKMVGDKAEVLKEKEEVDEVTDEQKEAEECCPTKAIEITD